MSGRAITAAEGTRLCRDLAAVLDQLADQLDAIGRGLQLAAAAAPPPRLDTCPRCGCLIRTTGRAPEVGPSCPGCRARLPRPRSAG